MSQTSDVKKVIAYTKGSGQDNDDSCGWAYLLEYADSENGEEKKDSFRMEMYAVLHTLEALKGVSDPIEIRSNNKKIICICKKENKYRENVDLWEKIFALIDGFGKEQLKFEFMSVKERDEKFDKVKENARKKSVE